jgi:hypothetical protein
LRINELNKIISSFTLYKFLDALTTPFIQTGAYRRGIIDAQGNRLKQDDELSFADKQVFTEFDQLVLSIRRLLLMIPDPYVRANLKNVTSSVKLIAEECEKIGGNSEYFMEIAMRELKACRLVEDGEGAPITNAMGGTFSTTNTNPQENPQGNIAGYDPPLATGKKIFRRKKPNKYYTDKNNSY